MLLKDWGLYEYLVITLIRYSLLEIRLIMKNVKLKLLWVGEGEGYTLFK